MSQPIATPGVKVFTIVGAITAILSVVLGAALLAVQSSKIQEFVTAEKVSVGDTFVSVLTTDGEVFSKGWNNQGQLGVTAGETVEVSSWLKVPFDRPIADLKTTEHSIALAEDGTVWAWGPNNEGQLGTGDRNSAFTPTQVTASLRFTSITATVNSVAAIDESGRLWTWGANNMGQLGNGETSKKDADITTFRPTVVETEARFASVTGGSNSLYALDTDSRLWTWGANNAGQLGNSSTNTVTTPTLVGGNTWRSIHASNQSEAVLGIDSNGWLHSWGSNAHGQLGNGTNWRAEQIAENQRVEDEIARIKNEDTARKTSLIEACVTTKEAEDKNKAEETRAEEQQKADDKYELELETYEEDLAAYEEALEELEEGEETDLTEPEKPTRVTVETKYVAPESLSQSTHYDACVTEVEASFTATDTSNMKPRVIAPPALTGNVSVPTLVTNGYQFSSAAVGSQNSYAVDVLGNLYAWGSDENGQTGIGLNEENYTQVPVKIAENARTVTAGNQYAAALTRSNELLLWGKNTDDVLMSNSATEENLLSPTAKGGGWDNILAGEHTMFGWKSNTAYSWGSNETGVMGAGQELAKVSQATEVPLKVRSIAAYPGGAVALGLSNQFTFWGANEEGQHGVEPGSGTQVASTRVVDLFQSISAGPMTSYATDTTGQLWGWGYNAFKLVDPNNTSQYIVYPSVLPYTEATQVAAGGTVAGAISENKLSVWNSSGETASFELDGINIAQMVAMDNELVLLTEEGSLYSVVQDFLAEGNGLVQIPDISKVASVTAGGDLTLGLTTGGKMFSYGADNANLLEAGSAALGDITEVSTNGSLVVIVNEKGIAWGWGENPYYVLGDAAIYDNPTALALTINPNEETN